MKLPPQFLTTEPLAMDVKSFGKPQDTLALLKLLAMGSIEIECGKFRDAEDVFSELDRDCMNAEAF